MSGPEGCPENKSGPAPSKHRAKPKAPWYHLNSWPGERPGPCAQHPANGGEPVPTYLGRPVQKECSRVRFGGGSFRRACTDRPLSEHPDMLTFPLIALAIIVFYDTRFSPVCQFLFPDFLAACRIACPRGLLCLFHSMATKWLPKTAGNRWGRRAGKNGNCCMATKWLPREPFRGKRFPFFMLLAVFRTFPPSARGVVLR